MRIPRTWVPLIAKRVLDDLIAKGLVISKVSTEVLMAEAERLIMEELIIEDRINDEVREILKKYTGEMQKGRLDYRKMFELTKKKIVQERGVIL
ncbi:MAG TPA: DUF507 family protein [Thermodesulfovibrionales bacterium]|nr:DUF507 family protein [Thermodesulfovibrionales bacterium]